MSGAIINVQNYNYVTFRCYSHAVGLFENTTPSRGGGRHYRSAMGRSMLKSIVKIIPGGTIFTRGMHDKEKYLKLFKESVQKCNLYLKMQIETAYYLVA